MKTAKDRFWAKVNKTETCWLWLGALINNEYGVFRLNDKNVLSHRFAYAEEKGPIAEGLTIDHLCRVKNCVNPAHLEAVSLRENIKRWSNSVTHCPAGHAYVGYNLYLDTRGKKRCRECHRIEAKLYRLKKRRK